MLCLNFFEGAARKFSLGQLHSAWDVTVTLGRHRNFGTVTSLTDKKSLLGKIGGAENVITVAHNAGPAIGGLIAALAGLKAGTFAANAGLVTLSRLLGPAGIVAAAAGATVALRGMRLRWLCGAPALLAGLSDLRRLRQRWPAPAPTAGAELLLYPR